jgi:hypothetical protein
MRRSLVASIIATAAIGIGGIVAAQTIQYRAQPVGEFEVPAVDTSASADFKLKVASDGMSARYDLKITGPSAPRPGGVERRRGRVALPARRTAARSPDR